jgi:hypothetical protein
MDYQNADFFFSLNFNAMVEIYLSKLEESLKALAEGNEDVEDQILEELDKIWFALSEEEQVVVRGEVYKRVRGLPYSV